MSYVAIFTTEDTKAIRDMWLDGKGTGEIAATLEKSARQIADKIKSMRRQGYNMPARSDGITLTGQYAYPMAWSTEDDKRFITAWNDEGISLEDIAESFRRTPNAMKVRANLHRERGKEMLLRLVRTFPDASPNCDARFPPFTLPDHMRFEDAVVTDCPGYPVYKPIRTPQHRSASSSLYGGRFLSTTGKSGAVV